MILLVGPSASGKTEITKALKPLYGIVKAITTTTRSPRVGEKNGVDYFYISKEKFESLLKEDFFVEHTLYNGNLYGCGKDQVAKNKCVALDPEGLKSFMKLNDPSIITFFLMCPEEKRRERMIKRGDNPEVIMQRLQGDAITFKDIKTDFVIDSNNATVQENAQEIFELYQKELKARNLL